MYAFFKKIKNVSFFREIPKQRYSMGSFKAPAKLPFLKGLGFL